MDDNTARVVRALHRLGQHVDGLRLVLERQSLGADPVIETFVDGRQVRFFLPRMTYDLIQKEIALQRTFYEIWLLNQTRRYLNPNAVVFDCGANIGNHSLYFAIITQVRRVFAFEPQHDVFTTLERNIALNELANVDAHQIALGAAAGTGGVRLSNPRNSGAARIAPTENGNVHVRPLDDFADAAPTLLKIDVEGMALDVLKGAHNILRTYKPRILVELRQEKGELHPVVSFLDNFGYRAEAINRSNFFFHPHGE